MFVRVCLIIGLYLFYLAPVLRAQTDCEQWSEGIRTYFNSTVTPLIMSKDFDTVDSIFVHFIQDPNPCESTGSPYYLRYYYYLHYLFENLKLKDSTLYLIDEALAQVDLRQDYESQVYLRDIKGIFLNRLGKMEEMNRTYTEAIAIAREYLPPGSIFFISAMSNYGNYYSWMGLKKAGLRHYEQLYLDILTKASSDAVPRSFRNISLAYSDYLINVGQYEKARAVINRIANRDSALYIAPVHIDETVANYTALANTYFKEGDVTSAISIFETHLDTILFRTETNTSYSSYFLNISLGFHMEDTSRIVQSLDYLRNSFTYRKIPPRQKYWMKLNHEQLRYAVKCGNKAIISEHLQIHLNNLWSNAIMVHQVADRERTTYLRTLREYTQFLLSIPDELLTTDQQKQIFEWHITLKNLDADTFITYKSWLVGLSEANPEMYREYMDLKGKYSDAYYLRSAELDSTDYYESKLAKLEEEAQAFYPGLRQDDLSIIRLDQLKSDMKEQSVFIDFAIVSGDHTQSSNRIYRANIVDPIKEGVQILDLFEEQEVIEMTTSTLGVDQINPFTRSQLNRKYYILVWDKLLPYLEGKTTLYIQADGLLNYLPVDALSPSGSASDMMFHTFDFRFLDDLRKMKKREGEKMGVMEVQQGLALGGIQYDCSRAQEEHSLKLSQKRGFRADSLQSELIYLPGTAAEVSAIEKMAKSKDIPMKILMGCEASAVNFLKEIQSDDVNFLHVATHGVYLPFDPEESAEKWIAQWNPGPHISLRSLLFFADAANEAVEDKTANWLNAQEISDLDLSHLDLVVLSACETGLGDMVMGEKSFSMGRAFLKGGARQVMVTLWSIPDDQALEFFKVFYTHLFIGKLSPQKALTRAKVDLSDTMHPSILSAFKILE